MNAIIYARYSSGGQTELSIEGQVKVCSAYAEENGLHIVGMYIDRALSGTSLEKRTDFKRMLNDSTNGSFSVVLVYQLDRFCRNRYDSAICKRILKQNNVRLISARETITEDASGVLMESLLEGMAEYYSIELSQKIRRGLLLNAEKGLYTGAGVAPGYKIKDKKFIIDKKTAPTVKRVFSLFLSGNKISEIIQILHTEGNLTTRGTPYNKSTVRRILTNRRYTGIYKHGGVEVPNAIPMLIDEATFREAQIKLFGNKKT